MQKTKDKKQTEIDEITETNRKNNNAIKTLGKYKQRLNFVDQVLHFLV